MQRSHSMSLSHHHQQEEEVASSFSPYANQHHHSLIISNGGCSSPSATTTPIQRSISVAAGVDSLPKSFHHHHNYSQHEADHAQQLLIDDGKLKQPAGPKIIKPEQTVHLIPLVLLLCALVLWLGTPSEMNDPALASKLIEPPPQMMVGESTATQQAIQSARQALSSVQSSTRRIRIHSAVENLRGESRS